MLSRGINEKFDPVSKVALIWGGPTPAHKIVGMAQNPAPPNEAHNARRFVWSNGLLNLADQIVAAKTVLPWLFQTAGVPAFFIGWLVPLRESGSMLPQAALTPWVTTQSSRKKLWLLASYGQAAAAAGMGVAALLVDGVALGVTILLLLAVLSLFRALSSIASKDVQGRTISKGRRGRVSGRATSLGGLATLAVGVGLALSPQPLPRWALAALIFLGAAAWVASAVSFSGIIEPESDVEPQGTNKSWWKDTWALFTDDANFREFVIVRSLLLVSALSTSFIVSLASARGQDFSGLGAFVIASGLASLVGGRISGAMSDRSSKNVMAYGALLASLVILAALACARWAPDGVTAWAFPVAFFGVTLAHTAVRVGRKTYVVDMAEGDQRTQYVGAANTMMGIILLLMGGISSAIALAGTEVALLFLALTGLVGVWRAARLQEVSAPAQQTS